jgi:tetratricopeptide (TPR) repeat protein
MTAEAGRVLRFKRASSVPLSADDARALALSYLTASGRTDETINESLSQPDVLLAVCRELRLACDIEPQRVADESIRAYRWVEKTDDLGVFDERDYFIGELALIAGNSCRHLGRLDEAEVWFDRSDAAYSHTINPGPNIAGVRYARITLHYARARYAHVIELAPALLETFERFGMAREALKTGLVFALALKCVGRSVECLELLKKLDCREEATREQDIKAMFKLHIGELLVGEGRIEEAGVALQEGAALVDTSKASIQVAYLHAVLGEALQMQGSLREAAAAYRASALTYRELAMPGWEAYARLSVAENLLAAGDHRQAEWEVLAALPAIDSQRLEPHAEMAISLLAKSVHARKTDPQALSAVRGYLKATG